MKISQSFLKDFIKYRRGEECGNLLHYKWVEGKLTPSSNAMKLGIYFEFLISGALPKDGIVPMPVYQESRPTKLYAEWQRVVENADRVKKLLDQKGIKIVHAGVTMEKDGYTGTIDLICEAQKDIIFDDGSIIRKGELFVIDLKYSGMLGDHGRWHEMGWDFTEAQKEYHKWQALTYNHVSGLPFYYLVCSSSNTEDLAFFRMDFSEQTKKTFLLESKHLREEFEILRDTDGFEPRPSYSKCQKCFLKPTCKDKHEFPQPKKIEL